MTARDLMDLRAKTLFTYDDRGRMALTNEPCAIARRPAFRLFLGRTNTGDVVRFGADVSESLARHSADIISAEPAGDEMRVSDALLARLRAALERERAVVAVEAGPAYRFPPASRGQDSAVRLTEANRALARETFPWLERESADWRPCFAVVRDGAAVSVCFSARIGPEVAEAGIETLPAFRGRGYATAVVAPWGDAIRASGRIPLYSTSWDNIASQGVVD
jgi:RimJ/RimL family protein N-acetyltransferase